MVNLQDYHLLLNAPIGYAKNPIQAKYEVPRTVLEPDYIVSPPPTGSKTIDLLPPEILDKVTGLLSQIDTLSLACTCKALEQPCLDRLYSRVVVDSKYTQFNKEHSRSYTYINQLYSLKKFFQSKRKQTIKTLYVLSLPDLLWLGDPQMKGLQCEFFQSLTNLHELVWLANFFDTEYLVHLPSHDLLTRLELNVSRCHLDDRRYSFWFPNLEILSIRPFASKETLTSFIRGLLAPEKSAAAGRSLQSLKLAQFADDPAVLLPPARYLSNPQEYLEATTHTRQDRTKFGGGIPEVILGKGGLSVLNVLTALSLDNILVCEEDAHRIAKGVILPQLRQLEMKNVSEVGESEAPKVGFLGILGPKVPGLQHLRLDFREASPDTVGPFLKCVKNLKSLDLVVRMNDVKKTYVDVDNMYVDYGETIGRLQQLEHLCVEVRVEMELLDKTQPTPVLMLEAFTQLTSLRTLRLNGNEGAHAVETFLDLLRALPQLTMLDVFGKWAGGPPNLGLGMVHPNVFDSWFKVQHVALLYWRVQSLLKYIRIRECVFEVRDGVANPRNHLDRWFDSQIRPGWGDEFTATW